MNDFKKGISTLSESVHFVRGLIYSIKDGILHGEEVFGKDKVNVLNSLNERGFFSDGPTLGNYCGGLWNSGKVTKKEEKVGNAPPLHSLDAACEIHDIGYKIAKGDKEVERQYDLQLAKALEELPDNPRKWKVPPAKGMEKAVNAYRYWAILFFKYFKHGVISQ